jgi:hypothetical protein
VTVKVAKVEWSGDHKDLKESGLKIDVLPKTTVTRTKGGLSLPMHLVSKTPKTFKVTMAHEWHGGEHAPTDLYASVTPVDKEKPEPFRPVYLFGEQEGKATEPLTLVGGTSLMIDLRMDWPGTGSVPATPLMTTAGTYKVRMLMVIDVNGSRQYVVGPETTVTLPPEK